MRLETSSPILRIWRNTMLLKKKSKLPCDTVLLDFIQISQTFMLESIICFHTLFKTPNGI